MFQQATIGNIIGKDLMWLLAAFGLLSLLCVQQAASRIRSQARLAAEVLLLIPPECYSSNRYLLASLNDKRL